MRIRFTLPNWTIPLLFVMTYFALMKWVLPNSNSPCMSGNCPVEIKAEETKLQDSQASQMPVVTLRSSL